ncbi:sigma 54-interacting transcriptional regulator [Desulfovibrio sp. OttesenSCG-928-C14]|nr:sigma 54-interacting transcriptional regulator [Desulfovibrio sp. OttesenSCG-928-C14]
MIQDPEISVSLLDDALNAAQDGIFIYRKDSSILYANKAALSLCGIPTGMFNGRRYTWKELQEAGFFYGEAALEALKGKQRVSTEFVNHLGIHLLCTATPILDDEGEVCRVVTNVRDITSLFELQSELTEKRAQLNSLKEELGYCESMQKKKFVHSSPKMRQLVATIDRIALTGISVLLLGDSGVGKSELAERIHKKSNRAAQKLVVVNCGAIPPSLCEAEFFGYEKGAFTGADSTKKGLFEEANGGTLILDEIGELPLTMQVKLLRVLQDGKVKRLGNQKEFTVDVRLVAATNQNLRERVKEGTFREDLYHRINVITLCIPPLRERPEDVKHLLAYFLARANGKYGMNKTMSPLLVSRLEEYDWPGNSREMEHLIERMVVLCTTDEIGCEYLSDEFNRSAVDDDMALLPLKVAAAQAEKALLMRAKCQLGSTRKMAEALKVSHVTIARKISEYGIE